MIQKLDQIKMAEAYSKATHKWVVYVNTTVYGEDQEEGVGIQAAPYLNFTEDMQIICDGAGFIVCDTEEEAWSIYNQTVGDDGPTTLNSYDGPNKIYALLIGYSEYYKEWQGLTENT